MEDKGKEWESERTSDQQTGWTDDFNTYSQSVSVDCDLLYQVTTLNANCETNKKSWHPSLFTYNKVKLPAQTYLSAPWLSAE